jgi:SAM-dependent methyltransferase
VLHPVLSLGLQPLANALLGEEDLQKPEPKYPLDLYICVACKLVQTRVHVDPAELVHNYIYFSSHSESRQRFARQLALDLIRRFHLQHSHFVIEIGSNDGYLLKHFVRRNIFALGIEPAPKVAEYALANNIDTEITFWSTDVAEALAEGGRYADVVVCCNVLTHVPELHDFIRGVRTILKPNGVFVLEFPYLYDLVRGNQFDSIYHEHFCYFTMFVVKKILMANDLLVFDVQHTKAHGGSLRVFACRAENQTRDWSPRVGEFIAREERAGMMDIAFYQNFAERVQRLIGEIRSFFERARKEGKVVVGCGAPAKGINLLASSGITRKDMPYTVERNPHKRGLYLPGTHIPIVEVERIRETKPDYIFVLPWNLLPEIKRQLAYIREWGGSFVVPIPEVQVVS